MIYYLGLDSEFKSIRDALDDDAAITHVEDVTAVDPHAAELLLIGPSVENPVKLVQLIVAQDPLLTIIILASPGRYNQIKQSLVYSMAVGKSTLCLVFNPSARYNSVFRNGIVRTQQKRRFSKFNAASSRKLSELTSLTVRLDNLGLILEHAPVGAVLVNRDFIVIGANGLARKMFPQLKSIALPLGALFPRNYQEVCNRIRSGSSEEPMTLEDGEGNYFEISSSSIPKEDAVILLIHDITESQQKNNRVKAILESLPNIAWTADLEGNVNYYNQGWFSFTGKSPGDGMGEGWASVVHEDDLPMMLSRWRQAVKGRTIYQHAARFRRFDGHYRWHLSKATPIVGKNKNVEMWVGTTTDIHDQVVANEELERKVKERTKALEESNAELEQFAHISSHDLQEPLRKIQTFAYIVKDELADIANENAGRYIDKIINTSKRMSKLLKDLLSFTKINQEEPQTIVDLNEVVDHVREDLELALSQSNATLSWEDLPPVKGRRAQLRQLFYNLISNSIKYSKPDVAPRIAITCSILDREKRKAMKGLEDTDHCEIVVKDNGIGFEQKYADQIFTVFERLHSESSFEGTGIGLAIAKKVVLNHSGIIFAVSSPGDGAEFHLILPAIPG